jgi:hypothetical protein
VKTPNLMACLERDWVRDAARMNNPLKLSSVVEIDRKELKDSMDAHQSQFSARR